MFFISRLTNSSTLGICYCFYRLISSSMVSFCGCLLRFWVVLFYFLTLIFFSLRLTVEVFECHFVTVCMCVLFWSWTKMPHRFFVYVSFFLGKIKWLKCEAPGLLRNRSVSALEFFFSCWRNVFHVFFVCFFGKRNFWVTNLKFCRGSAVCNALFFKFAVICQLWSTLPLTNFGWLVCTWLKQGLAIGVET